MSIQCRVCFGKCFAEPLLQYRNMPKAAQLFPDADSLASEKGIDLDVCQCMQCGLIQLGNDPVPYYRKVIRAAAFSEEMKAFRKQQFIDLIQKYSLAGKKVVEIGCGRGEYLSIMQQAGADAYGLEQSVEAVQICKQNGLQVSQGFVENREQHIPGGLFDAFFMLNFLEHLPDPNTTLMGICNNLKEDAIGIIEVPNFDMMLQNNFFAEFIPDHLFYFTKNTLSTTLNKNGFEVIACDDIWHNYIISMIVKKRKKLDVAGFRRSQKKLQKQFADYFVGFKNKKIAVWGAGHQALALITLLNLTDKIKYVVDSATFKQNKYTPATHLPIVAPDMLNSDPVDAIIVMAASYSDEVVKIIREKFNNISIAALRNFRLEICN